VTAQIIAGACTVGVTLLIAALVEHCRR